jgi:hypothetical protein
MSDTFINVTALDHVIETLIAVRDAIDGDPDFENATDLEDDFALSPQAVGSCETVPGCPAADPGDISWTEFHTRGRHKDDPGVVGRYGNLLEDDEEDDAGEEDDDPAQCSEDEISCGRPDFGRTGAGCELSDPGGCEHDGREHEDGA